MTDFFPSIVLLFHYITLDITFSKKIMAFYHSSVRQLIVLNSRLVFYMKYFSIFGCQTNQKSNIQEWKMEIKKTG